MKKSIKTSELCRDFVMKATFLKTAAAESEILDWSPGGKSPFVTAALTKNRKYGPRKYRLNNTIYKSWLKIKCSTSKYNIYWLSVWQGRKRLPVPLCGEVGGRHVMEWVGDIVQYNLSLGQHLYFWHRGQRPAPPPQRLWPSEAPCWVCWRLSPSSTDSQNICSLVSRSCVEPEPWASSCHHTPQSSDQRWASRCLRHDDSIRDKMMFMWTLTGSLWLESQSWRFCTQVDYTKRERLKHERLPVASLSLKYITFLAGGSQSSAKKSAVLNCAHFPPQARRSSCVPCYLPIRRDNKDTARARRVSSHFALHLACHLACHRVALSLRVCVCVCVCGCLLCGSRFAAIPAWQQALALFFVLFLKRKPVVSKPNVYRAVKSRRTKASWGLLSAYWPVRGGSEQQCFLYFVFNGRILPFIACVQIYPCVLN